MLSMGVYLGASTRIVDRATGKVIYGEVPPYSVVVSGSMPRRRRAGPALYCAVIVKKVDEQTRSKTSHQRTAARLRHRGERPDGARRSPLLWLFFGLKGRVSRRVYWLSYIFFVCVNGVVLGQLLGGEEASFIALADDAAAPRHPRHDLRKRRA